VNAVPVICALLALPAGWAGGLLMDRVPDRLALWPPPGIRLTGRYLAVQVVMLGTFIALGYRFESAPALLIVGYLVLAAVLITVSAVDIACFRLPDRIVLPGLGLSVLIVVVESLRASHPQRILLALSGLGIYFGILLVFHLISPAGMGFGDVKLAALMGLYLGWLAAGYATVFVLVLWALGLGALAASLLGVTLLAIQGRSRRTPIPFGPYLAFGTLLVVLLSPHLINFKLNA
jgi:leader peptidase (prepilin peptidase)/N-methyltransferase